MKNKLLKLFMYCLLPLSTMQTTFAMQLKLRSHAVKALQATRSTAAALLPFVRSQITKRNLALAGAAGLAVMGYRLLESDATIKNKFLSSIIMRGRPALLAEEAQETSEHNKANRPKGIMLLDNNYTRWNVHMPIFGEHRQAEQKHKEQLSFGGHEYTVTHQVEDGLLLRKHSFSIQFNR